MIELDGIADAEAALDAAANVAKSGSLPRDPPMMGLELVILPTDDTRPPVLLLLPVLPIVVLDLDDLDPLSLCDEEDDDVDEDGSLS